jgi:hypothetical protein
LFIGLHLFAGLYFPLRSSWQARKNGLLSSDDLQLNSYLNGAIKERFHVVQPLAWQILRDVLPGMVIKVPDVRTAHWEAVTVNENRHEIQLEMRYVQNPLGVKVSRLYPRKLSCAARLIGSGASSEVVFTFSAESAMDYQNVCEIITSTLEQVRCAMEMKPSNISNQPATAFVANPPQVLFPQ